MNHNYRKLSASEISLLKQNGCRCNNWDQIEVTNDFNPSPIENTCFSGNVKLGSFKKDFVFPGGVVMKSGIFNAKIHNCVIGNDVFIHQINNYMANYYIGDEVVIENVDLLAVTGNTSFGNGTEVTVLIESGGRELPIYDGLSAPVAYILTCYRYDIEVVNQLKKLISSYIFSIKSEMGIIGKRSHIQNCHLIKNVKIGSGTTLEGVLKLENGSINSLEDAPIFIGSAVIADNFIINSDTIIKDGVILRNCFIGQGCRLGKQFSVENSVFFANSEGFQGEVCSIFAGPYTVIHHKSTLLIAGMFSFFNAGSGTNQSNHLYKLGPLHQGILERGCKTGSSSYLLWPVRLGAFSIVIGKHYQNFDTSNLPFSYLVESNCESFLIPAVNFRSIGNIRDGFKWPVRDRRQVQHRIDLFVCDIINPYIVQKLIKGRKILENLQTQPDEILPFQNLKIKKSTIPKGIKLYQLGIIKFLGDCLIKHLGPQNIQNPNDLNTFLGNSLKIECDDWVDLAGLLAPKIVVEDLLHKIESGKMKTLDELNRALFSIYENYADFEWHYALSTLARELNKDLDAITSTDLILFIQNWQKVNQELKELLFSDAQKEYSENTQISFGMDGGTLERQTDFRLVRGDMKENEFLIMLTNDFEKQLSRGEELILKLKQVA